MGTRAKLGIRHSNGTITACYIHLDGYPSHMIPAIEDYVARMTTTGLTILIKKAQQVGGMRCFNPAPHRKTIFLKDNTSYVIDEDNWADPCSDWADYFYLVNYETGNITSDTKV
jgi:hypothetical protein